MEGFCKCHIFMRENVRTREILFWWFCGHRLYSNYQLVKMYVAVEMKQFCKHNCNVFITFYTLNHRELWEILLHNRVKCYCC